MGRQEFLDSPRRIGHDIVPGHQLDPVLLGIDQTVEVVELLLIGRPIARLIFQAELERGHLRRQVEHAQLIRVEVHLLVGRTDVAVVDPQLRANRLGRTLQGRQLRFRRGHHRTTHRPLHEQLQVALDRFLGVHQPRTGGTVFGPQRPLGKELPGMKSGLVLLAGFFQCLVILLIMFGLAGRGRYLLFQGEPARLQGQQGFLIRPGIFHHGDFLALDKGRTGLDVQRTDHTINGRSEQDHRRIQNRPGGRGRHQGHQQCRHQ